MFLDRNEPWDHKKGLSLQEPHNYDDFLSSLLATYAGHIMALQTVEHEVKPHRSGRQPYVDGYVRERKEGSV